MQKIHNILIVDDEELVRESLSDFLVDSDYTAGLASTGNEGINEAKSFSYDIIIVDMTLPDMTGEEFILKATQEGIHAHFIIHTGHSDYQVPQYLRELGISENSVLSKPLFDMNILLDMIRSLQ